MPLESASFVNGLVTANPAGTDSRREGDDHIRVVKTALKNTFPNATKAFYFPTILSTKTGNYTVVTTEDHALVPMNCSSGNLTVTLPASPPVAFSVAVVKTDGTTNTVTVQGSGADTLNGAASRVLASQYEQEVYFYTGSEWYVIAVMGDPFPIANGGTGATTASGARSNLGLAIGTNVQAFSALLQDIATLSLATGDMLYFDGTDLQRLPIGTANQRLVVSGGVPTWSTPAFAEYFESPERANPGVSGSIVEPHGLSGRPREVGFEMVCTTAEFGYSIGDRVLLGWNNNAGNAAGMMAKIDATNVSVKFGANPIPLIRFDTGGSANFTTANWNVIIKAWR